jgi:hypothetical protein
MVLIGTDPPTWVSSDQYKRLIILKTNLIYINLNWDDCPRVLQGLKDDLPKNFNAKPY